MKSVGREWWLSLKLFWHFGTPLKSHPVVYFLFDLGNVEKYLTFKNQFSLGIFAGWWRTSKLHWVFKNKVSCENRVHEDFLLIKNKLIKKVIKQFFAIVIPSLFNQSNFEILSQMRRKLDFSCDKNYKNTMLIIGHLLHKARHLFRNASWY